MSLLSFTLFFLHFSISQFRFFLLLLLLPFAAAAAVTNRSAVKESFSRTHNECVRNDISHVYFGLIVVIVVNAAMSMLMPLWAKLLGYCCCCWLCACSIRRQTIRCECTQTELSSVSVYTTVDTRDTLQLLQLLLHRNDRCGLSFPAQPTGPGPLARGVPQFSTLSSSTSASAFCHGRCRCRCEPRGDARMSAAGSKQGSGACLLSLLPACKLHKILPGYKSILLFTEYVICGECGSREAGKLLLPESIQHPAEPTKVFSFFLQQLKCFNRLNALAILPQGVPLFIQSPKLTAQSVDRIHMLHSYGSPILYRMHSFQMVTAK